MLIKIKKSMKNLFFALATALLVASCGTEEAPVQETPATDSTKTEVVVDTTKAADTTAVAATPTVEATPEVKK